MPPALRISRSTPSESPLAFLYQTSTILRRSYASDAFGEMDTLELKKQARHKISADWSKVNRSPTRPRRSIKPAQSRSNPPQRTIREPPRRTAPVPQEREWIDHVPFEGVDTRPATILDRLQGQTITRHEFNIFKDILARGASAESDAKEAALKRKRRLDSTGRSKGVIREEVEMPELLRPLAEEAQNISAQKREEVEEEIVVKEEGRVTKYRQEVQKLMDSKKTDVELWMVWEARLKLDVLAVLEKSDQKEGAVDLQTLTTALPQLLSHMSALLRSNFPGSSFSMSILPALRSLGREAFTLGATTDLFNSHMRCLLETYTDLDSIIDCLADMEREVFEFDDGTHQLLEDIFSRAEQAEKEGGALKAFWETDRKTRGLEKLEEWEAIVAERIGKAEARRKEWARKGGGEEEDELRVTGMSVSD